MGILEAILLGIIQGIAEFLPISSSGHLAIFQKLFGMDQVGISFDVFLHIGTLIAVFIVFWKDILRLFVDGVGIVADSCVNVYRFFRSKNKKEPVEYIRVIRTAYRKFALLVIVSTIPTGIIGYLGKELVSNASDTLIIPGICLLVTAVLEIPDMGKDMATTGVASYVVGMIVAAVVGYICIKTMLVVVRNKKFKYFSYYCAVVGLVAIIASFVIK